MKRINKKGFTLIELLAVIVILAVVMAIAIPSMNKVIDNSKKDTLVSTAQEYINGAKTMLLSAGELPDYNHVLVVPIDKIELDRGGKSPYTSTSFESSRSYVVVVNKANQDTAAGASEYEYYIALYDRSKNCLQTSTEAQLNAKAKDTRKLIASGTDACEKVTDGGKGITDISSGSVSSINRVTDLPQGTITYTIYGK